MDAKIRFDFSDTLRPSLTQSGFYCPVSKQIFRCVRGKTAGAYIGFGTFQWTSGVRALSILLCMTKRSTFGNCTPIISGGRPSLACSLDEAINKSTTWLAEMFGVDSRGRIYAKTIMLRTNSSVKRAGEVTLRINPRILVPQNIEIRLDGSPITTEAELLALEQRMIANSLDSECNCNIVANENMAA